MIVLSIIVMVPRFDMPPPLPAGNSSFTPAPLWLTTAGGDRRYTGVVVNTAALATTDGNIVESRTIAVNGAIHNHQCRAASIGGIIVDTTPSRRSRIPVDDAVDGSLVPRCLLNCRCKCRRPRRHEREGRESSMLLSTVLFMIVNVALPPLLGIIVDTAASRIGVIPADSAVQDRQCRAACRTIVIDSATTIGLSGAVLHGAAVHRQYGVIVQDARRRFRNR